MKTTEELEIVGRQVVAEIITLKLPGGTAWDALNIAFNVKFAEGNQGGQYSAGWAEGYIRAAFDTIKFHHLETEYRVVGTEKILTRWEPMHDHHPDTLEFRRVWRESGAGGPRHPFTRWQPVNAAGEAAAPLTTDDIAAERLAAEDAKKAAADSLGAL